MSQLEQASRLLGDHRRSLASLHSQAESLVALRIELAAKLRVSPASEREAVQGELVKLKLEHSQIYKQIAIQSIEIESLELACNELDRSSN